MNQEKMASSSRKGKSVIRSMNDIVNFMLASDDDIDLGQHASDESDFDSGNMKQKLLDPNYFLMILYL